MSSRDCERVQSGSGGPLRLAARVQEVERLILLAWAGPRAILMVVLRARAEHRPRRGFAPTPRSVFTPATLRRCR